MAMPMDSMQFVQMYSMAPTAQGQFPMAQFPMGQMWMNEMGQWFCCVPQECAGAAAGAWSCDWGMPQAQAKMPPKHKYLAMAMERGCWELQAMIRKASNAELNEMASEFRGHVREAVESGHGNHVIQKFVDYMRPGDSYFILEELMAWAPLARLAKHRYACRVLERILEQYPPNAMKDLLDTLVTNTKDLMVDPFGNYVLRVLLEHGPSSHKAAVAEVLKQNLGRLAKNNKGCALLDAVMSYGAPADQKQVAQELILQGLVPGMRRLRSSRDAMERIFLIAEELPPTVQWSLQQLSRKFSFAPWWRRWD
ncbi:unnamed protein product [Effrenium voratum]|uniref:PUM-HD domain-containing protein n=1 Tax=Effrenium voratum TaxID=2562239 RepID=A0AA36MQW8_9DINO|nr:unnamed protein product [Effrenium voratum]